MPQMNDWIHPQAPGLDLPPEPHRPGRFAELEGEYLEQHWPLLFNHFGEMLMKQPTKRKRGNAVKNLLAIIQCLLDGPVTISQITPHTSFCTRNVRIYLGAIGEHMNLKKRSRPPQKGVRGSLGDQYWLER